MLFRGVFHGILLSFFYNPVLPGPLREGDSFHCCPQVTKVSDQGTCDATLATICVVHFLGRETNDLWPPPACNVTSFLSTETMGGRGTELCWWQHSDHSGMMKWPTQPPGDTCKNAIPGNCGNNVGLYYMIWMWVKMEDLGDHRC